VPLPSWAYLGRRSNQRSGNSESTGIVSRPRSLPWPSGIFYLPSNLGNFSMRRRGEAATLNFQQTLKFRPDFKT
jgi:hypothetical protein